MKYGDYLGTAISQHMTSKYLTKSLTHLLQARIVEVIMYDCPVLVSSARSSISKPLIEIHIFESLDRTTLDPLLFSILWEAIEKKCIFFRGNGDARGQLRC